MFFERNPHWLLGFIALMCGQTANATEPDYSGAWVVMFETIDGSTSADLEIRQNGNVLEGTSGPLDILGSCPLKYTGEVSKKQLKLVPQCFDKGIGLLNLTAVGDSLKGSGDFFGSNVNVLARRPSRELGGTPNVHVYDPKEFHPVTSPNTEPVLRIRSGDRVKTRTIDAYGLNENGVPASMPGNPGTGPFYVEGAMPGDTVGIRIISLRPNRSFARMNTKLDGSVLMSGHSQQDGAVQDPIWIIDSQRKTASLRTSSERLKRFEVALRPMLGGISVAPAGFSVANRELGEWGGNMDYNEIREGLTLYLTVNNKGALIFLGDGHAVQGDGEIAGQGLETSLEVEFEVELIKGKAFPRPAGFPPLGPWAENDKYIMVSGIGGDVTNALQRATTGLSLWLKDRHGLDDSEIAAVLGTSVEYDIAEAISAKAHVVAKISKDVLKLLD